MQYKSPVMATIGANEEQPVEIGWWNAEWYAYKYYVAVTRAGAAAVVVAAAILVLAVTSAATE